MTLRIPDACRSIIQDNQDMDVALVKYRVLAVQVNTSTECVFALLRKTSE